MRRPATFTILAVVLLAASLIGCAGSARQTESEAVTVEQAPDQPTEQSAMAREQATERGIRRRVAAAEAEMWAAVAAGKITEEQAREAMAAFMEQVRINELIDEEARSARYHALVEQVRAAVSAGEITEHEAEVLLAEMWQQIYREQTHEQGLRERYAIAMREIEAAVAAGEISEEDAEVRLTEMRQRLGRAARGAGERERMAREQAPERDIRERFAAAEAEMRAAVAAGEITKEDAEKRLLEMRQHLARAGRGTGERERVAMSREEIAGIRAELAAAVEAGEITKEQAQERMARLREWMAREQSPERDMRERFAAAAEQIQAAAAAGEITEEQARERLEGMRERMAMAERRAGERERMPQGRENALFNGRDLSGWEYFLEDENASMEDVWSVEDGILVCTGDPRGYLATVDEYENFRLVVEWRWPEEPGNSGVLLRITGEPQMLPNCVEAQLRSGSAGDMYGFNGFTIGGDEERLSEISIGWSLPALERNEKEPGEWNRYEITVFDGTITVRLNGVLVNEATNCDVRPGRIGLQSEGGVIHFRSITLVPIGGR